MPHFKLNENIPLWLQGFLTEPGPSVSTISSEGLSEVSDSAFPALCEKESFILITNDTDSISLSQKKMKRIIIFPLKIGITMKTQNRNNNKNSKLE